VLCFLPCHLRSARAELLSLPPHDPTQPLGLLGGQVPLPRLGLCSVACPHPGPALPRLPGRDAVDEDVLARGGDGALRADVVEQEGPDAPADHTELYRSGRGRGVPHRGSQASAMVASFMGGRAAVAAAGAWWRAGAWALAAATGGWACERVR
jgi:hypothetical protein